MKSKLISLLLKKQPNRLIRKITFYLLALTFSLTGCTEKKSELARKPVLQVNGHNMTAKQFGVELGKILNNYNSLAVKSPDTVSRAKNHIIREFIIFAVTKDWAADNQVIVKRQDLNGEIATIKRAYPDETAFKTALAEQDITYDEWKERVHFRVLQRLVLERLMADAEPISEAEIKSYYDSNKAEFKVPERVRLRQVVVKTQVEAERILEQLKKGEKLSGLAKKFSIAPEADQGGDLGWIEKGSLEIYDRAFKLKKGRRSEILESSFGFHIYEVIDKSSERTLKMSEVKEQVKQRIKANREQAIYSAWLEEQLLKAKVLKDEQLIASIDVETRGSR